MKKLTCLVLTMCLVFSCGMLLQAGAAASSSITLTYTHAGQSVSETLRNEVSLSMKNAYAAGDSVVVDLPEGVDYIWFSMGEDLGEVLLYVPGDSYTYTVPAVQDCYPSTFFSRTINTVTVRIATEAEIATQRNLALNPYDLQDANSTVSVGTAPNTAGTAAFPHAFANMYWEDFAGDTRFQVRNAIDGIAIQGGHGSYPNQSWGPNNQNGNWLGVDFGRNVILTSVILYTRADWKIVNGSSDHDGYYTSGILRFSDGTSQPVTIGKIPGAIIFTLDTPVTCSWVELADLTSGDGGWCGVMELQAMGADAVPGINTPDEATQQVIDAIASLTENSSAAEIQAVQLQYEALEETQQALVSNREKLQSLLEALPESLLGDLSQDGALSVTDVVLLRKAILAGRMDPIGDMNRDGALSVTDVVLLRKAILTQ